MFNSLKKAKDGIDFGLMALPKCLYIRIRSSLLWPSEAVSPSPKSAPPEKKKEDGEFPLKKRLICFTDLLRLEIDEDNNVKHEKEKTRK